MEVILLEKYKKLGEIGDVVAVKGGFARNYLIPTKKAIFASEENKKVFELKKEEIKKEFSEKRNAAEKILSSLDGKHIILVKQAGEDERLYGSVSSSDIAKAIKEQLVQDIHKSSIKLIIPIKSLGSHVVSVNIFSDINAALRVIISRSHEEALQILKKEAEALKEAAKKAAQKLEEEAQMKEAISEEPNEFAKKESKKKKISTGPSEELADDHPSLSDEESEKKATAERGETKTKAKKSSSEEKPKKEKKK